MKQFGINATVFVLVMVLGVVFFHNLWVGAAWGFVGLACVYAGKKPRKK